MFIYLKSAVIISQAVIGLIHLVNGFGEGDEKVGKQRLTDGVVI